MGTGGVLDMCLCCDGVVVFLPRPMEGMGRLLFSELPVISQAAGVVVYLYIYHSEHYSPRFGP